MALLITLYYNFECDNGSVDKYIELTYRLLFEFNSFLKKELHI